METLQELAISHLLLRLAPANRALSRAVERQQHLAARLARPDAVPLCITDDHVTALLADVEALQRKEEGLENGGRERFPLTGEEEVAEEELRRQARTAGLRLPLDMLVADLGLTSFEQQALLIAAAPELDRSYERLFAYVLDDLNRRFPCVDLLVSLTGGSPAERLARLSELGPVGRLRRRGLLVPLDPAPTEARQELRLGPGALEFLLTGRGDAAALFNDPDEVCLRAEAEAPPGIDLERLRRIGGALAQGEVEVVGVWSNVRGAADEAAEALLALASLPARRLRLARLPAQPGERRREIDRVLRAASALGAVLWIPANPLAEPNGSDLAEDLTAALTASRVPVVLSGRNPFRPTPLLASRSYAEVEVAPADYAARQAIWGTALGELDADLRSDLAARYRLGLGEVRAAALVASTAAHLASNGRPAALRDHVEAACAAVTRRRSHAFATLIEPRRGPDDLVLPPEMHRQILEVARFFRAWPRVAEDWGFGRLVTGGGGIRVLFTGESGTGKTLAAEVIAGEVGVPLVRVDLARVVSKWVGETEKNLSAAFDEAEDSHAVLFFDEADALFGKRAEVHHGTDRYANLEVSYLLQRLEDSQGLVILASNLRVAIDDAFTRRFQVTLHFPRPGEAERRRIWEVALPPSAPRAADLDLDALARLDMTGGSIASAARTAALMAADDGNGGGIGMEHLVRGVARQFNREARLLRSAELGIHARLAQEV